MTVKLGIFVDGSPARNFLLKQNWKGKANLWDTVPLAYKSHHPIGANYIQLFLSTSITLLNVSSLQ